MTMSKMLPARNIRSFARPRSRNVLLVTVAVVVTYFLIFSGPAPDLHAVPYLREKPGHGTGGRAGSAKGDDFQKMKHLYDVDISEIQDWHDPTDREDPNDVHPGYEGDGKTKEAGEISRTQHEKDLRKLWRYAYWKTRDFPSTGLIYGNTLADLDYVDDRDAGLSEMLREDPDVEVSFTDAQPVRFNPYPDYNSEWWTRAKRAPYVPCKGPTGELIEDLLVFKGKPHEFPDPHMGAYSALGLDPNICWERETRLAPYGFVRQMKKVGGEFQEVQWDNVNWGDLQRRCVHKNAKRYDLNRSRKNPYLNAYPETAKLDDSSENKPADAWVTKGDAKEKGTQYQQPQARDSGETSQDSTQEETKDKNERRDDDFETEKRTAILLRAYTGKQYTENDKEFIRAMISELSLKSGGEYEVFLLVHVKDEKLRIFDDPETYQSVLREHVPAEFHGLTVLWNDEVVWDIYTEMKDPNERTVHTAQWLSVQKFSHDHPQFDFIWNWEMDFRYTGHHYDLLDSLDLFGRQQPRKGLWERSERWYIPEYHGDYNTDFRKDIENRYDMNDTVWGPVDLPFINPVGPKPPADSATEDDYIWGVGEDADFLTLGPIFNPVDSLWIIGNHVWGYNDENHASTDVPRRTTIITHSRVSKRLLDIMHVENMRGNHVASEMTPQTVALHHGFKAVFAPHPIWMDRDWDGEFLNKWFNPGSNGEAGGRGSPMGWGRERRYQGSTWYYRAEPPNRLFNNWMGWVDTGIGGKRWEQQYGRPCLPSMMLHPVKDSQPTMRGYASGFELAYG